jgi:hypothetical protein
LASEIDVAQRGARGRKEPGTEQARVRK